MSQSDDPRDKPAAGLYSRLTSYGDPGFSRFMRRIFMASAGYDRTDVDRPIIGIADTSSDFNPCHRDMPAMVAAVKRGVLEAGGLPLSFPTCSLHEILMSPTTMLYRNLLAMETEEMIKGHPMDGVVLLGGCDKTVPAQLMAAASADLPAISLVTGPMRANWWRGERVGAGSDARKAWARHRAGDLTEEDLDDLEPRLCATGGTCMVMGTASTMACLSEVLGMMLPGAATPPSGSGARLRAAAATGRRIVEMVAQDLRPSRIITRASLENAITFLMSAGGSTNSLVHLLALSGRLGLGLTLEDFDRISRKVPLLIDCKPAGKGFLEDLDLAGGVPVVLKALEPLLNLDTVGVTGRRLGELLAETDPPQPWQDTVRTLENPLGGTEALLVLRGNLAPRGAVLKKAATTGDLLVHEGPAVVFESPDDAVARLDDPSLGITKDHVLVLRGAGPKAMGMPEAGSLPIPRALARQGVRDMVRISDGRMSGTAFGTIILHVAPESEAGGPLALVRDGDRIRLDVNARTLDLLVPEEELQARAEKWTPAPGAPRGWQRLYQEHVLQADEGVDLDFLR